MKGTFTMAKEAEQWLDEHETTYIALTQFHMQSAQYYTQEEYELIFIFATRDEAIDNYLVENEKAIQQKIMDQKPLGLQTAAIVKVPPLAEYISGKDIVAAINSNIYNTHGINGQVLDSDVFEDAYEFLDSNAKKIITEFIANFEVKTKDYMLCHFKSHQMGLPEMVDWFMKKDADQKLLLGQDPPE